MSDDELDGFLSRKEVLEGLPGRRAASLLDRIERRTAYLLAHTRRALRAILTWSPEQSPDHFDFYKVLELSTHPAFQPSILDLDRFVEAWQGAVPADPRVRAALAHNLGQKYTFTKDAIPDLVPVLGLDDPRVQQEFADLFDEPLESIYAEETVLKTQTFWGDSIHGVANDAISEMEEQVDWIRLEWGETLFRQGERGDNMYVMVNGRVRVMQTMPDGSERFVREMGPGEIIGEIALITDDVRTATVYAVRDSELVRLTRTGLEQIMARHPAAMLRIMQQMLNRMNADRTPTRQESRVKSIALIPTGPSVPIAEFGRKLAEALATYGPVLHLDAERFGELQGEAMLEGVNTLYQISWLEEQEAAHRFIIYEGQWRASPWTRRCFRQADRILLVGQGGSTPELGEAEELLGGPKLERIATGQELVIAHRSRQQTPSGTAAWLKRRPKVRRHYHVALDHTPDFERLARFLAGRAVGIALGGGGARGLAHLGVLRAMREANIPVDAIGGVSFGAVVAAAVATGYSIEEQTELFREFATNFRAYIDPTIPLVSVVIGRKINRTFRGYFGDDTRIEDLWMHAFTVSANLNKGGPQIHDHGLLWRAVRASISIPVLFPPVLEDGDLLTDGGAFTNNPSDIMLDLLGSGSVIGSSVTPKEEIKERYSFGDEVSGLDLLWKRLTGHADEIKVPNAIDVLVWAMGLSNSYLRPAQDAAADLLLQLPVEQYDLFDFESFDAMVEAGYQAANDAFETWEW